MSEREAFETEMERLSGKVKGVYYSDNEGGYVVEDILKNNESAKILATIYNVSFEMWKASANRQGYKLVPVEPTYDMYDAFYKEHDKYEEGDVKPFKESYKAMIGAVE